MTKTPNTTKTTKTPIVVPPRPKSIPTVVAPPPRPPRPRVAQVAILELGAKSVPPKAPWMVADSMDSVMENLASVDAADGAAAMREARSKASMVSFNRPPIYGDYHGQIHAKGLELVATIARAEAYHQESPFLPKIGTQLQDLNSLVDGLFKRIDKDAAALAAVSGGMASTSSSGVHRSDS